jgi:proline racemase
LLISSPEGNPPLIFHLLPSAGFPDLEHNMNPHTFICVDAHTCGNPVRVVCGGAPILPNVSMAEKRQIFLRDHDWVRQALMFEPRGHDVMSGSVLYPPSRDDCDLGVLFIEVSGCLPMCGHGTIGTVTVALEQGFVVPKTEGKLALEVPAGRVEVEYRRNGRFAFSMSLPIFMPAKRRSMCPVLASWWSMLLMVVTSMPSSNHRRTGLVSIR